MFGVDEQEVQDFLQAISSQVEELIHEKNSLKDALRERDIAIHELKDRDQVLKNTISTASQMAERLRIDAEREAKLVIADAQQKGEILLRDARDSLKKIYQEIADLKRIRMQFEVNLKALAQAHLSLIDQGEKYVPPVNIQSVNLQQTETTDKKAGLTTDVSPLASHLDGH